MNARGHVRKLFRRHLVLLLGAVLTPRWTLGQDSERRRFTPEDIHRIRDVRELAIAPDGDWVAYTVRSTDIDSDRRNADLFMVSWDGATRIQLTHSDGSEASPRFSPDGNYLAFITARGGDDSGSSKDPATKSQVWVLNRSGGEAERLTEMPGGVSNFEWSPDTTKLALVSKDPKDDETEGDDEASVDSKKADTPNHIVIDRYKFKHQLRADVSGTAQFGCADTTGDLSWPVPQSDQAELHPGSHRADDPLVRRVLGGGLRQAQRRTASAR